MTHEAPNAILVAYATKHGSTREVARDVAAMLWSHGFHVDLRAASDVEAIGEYEAVVLGGALYMGRLHRDARAFLKRHRVELSTIPFAVFATGPRTLEEPDVDDAREQLEHALTAFPELDPIATTIFGGVLDPASLSFPFNRMPAVDARDWDAVRGWADELAAELDAVVHALA